ncbi:hypothetical protein HY339_00765 [Candidatus Gottesmanbacteria bacterium]|nr:hypothetical protein [Candidatus Gottesmanbacteria bacterium]
MADSPTAEAAITAALSHNWKDAIRINTLILKESKNDIATLNRLGFAYAQMGKRTIAKATFGRVLKLDPYNQIAHKHIKNVSSARKQPIGDGPPNHVTPLSFLEEPGVTKLVSCVHLAPTQTLGALSPGSELILKPRNHCVEVRAAPNTYVAALPDDVSFKLIKLIASGNRYQAIVKGVAKKSLTIMLRETVRGKKFANQPSFTAQRTVLSGGAHAPPVDQSEEKPNTLATGEDEEQNDSPTQGEP